MDDETAFLTDILAAPDDEGLRLVFADWLEEHARWSVRPSRWNYGSPSCKHRYPQLHRIRDIRLRREPFRVLRCAECKDRLRAIQIEESAWNLGQGVPLWLQGDALQQWIRDELAEEAGETVLDRPTDWERYRR